MILGFTGTKEGLNDFQLANLRRYLDGLTDPYSAIHGVCIGADTQFHEEVYKRGMPIIGRPMWDNPARSRIPEDQFRTLHPPEDPLDRNRKIVRECDVLIVGPAGPERLRSGTWMTYRYAVTLQKRMMFLWWKFFS